MLWFKNLKAKSGFGVSKVEDAAALSKALSVSIADPDLPFRSVTPYRSRRTRRDRFRLWLASFVQRLYLFLLPKLYTGKSYTAVILLEMFKRDLLSVQEVIKFESTRDTVILDKMEEFLASGDWETPLHSKPVGTKKFSLGEGRAVLVGSRPLYDARSAPSPSRKGSKAALQQVSMKRNRSWLGPVKVEEDKPKKKAAKRKPAKKKKVVKKRKK